MENYIITQEKYDRHQYNNVDYTRLSYDAVSNWMPRFNMHLSSFSKYGVLYHNFVINYFSIPIPWLASYVIAQNVDVYFLLPI